MTVLTFRHPEFSSGSPFQSVNYDYYLILNNRVKFMHNSYVYIMSNKHRTTFYIGVTSNLGKRISEHLTGTGSKFVQKYNLHDLVYYEHFTEIIQAITREKQLKKWHRKWKINLIKRLNPRMIDLKPDLWGDPETSSG